MAILVERKEYNRRMAICGECPWFEKTFVRCKQCGCFLKAKARLEGQFCPIGKWHSDSGGEQTNKPGGS